MNQKSELEQVKINVRSLIQSHSDGVFTIQQLQKDYRGMMGHPLPLLGRKNVESFLREMKDVVKIYGNGPHAILEYVPNEKSKHIGELVKQQRPINGKRRKRNVSKRPYRPERILKFPEEISDESDWDEPVMEQQPKEEVKIKSIDKTLDDNGPQMSTISDSSINFNKNLKNSRAEQLLKLRKLRMEKDKDKAEQSADNKVNSDATSEILMQKMPPTIFSSKAFEKHCHLSLSNTEANQSVTTSTVEKSQVKSRFLQIISRIPNRAKFSVSTSNGCESEKEEAIPAAAITDIVEHLNSMEITKKTATGTKLTDIVIPAFTKRFGMLKVGQIVPLYVSEIHSPLLFYFQLYDTINELLSLTAEMQKVYNMLARYELCLSENHLHHGMACAANYNDQWHRARIISVPPDPNEFSKNKLYLVDEGCYCELTTRHLKLLAPRFSYLPSFAIRGSLANIKFKEYPPDSDAARCFNELVHDKYIYGCITDIETKSPQVKLILLDTNVSPKKQINEILIKHGFAEKA